MSRERSLSWASPAFGAIRPIGSWWATSYSVNNTPQFVPLTGRLQAALMPRGNQKPCRCAFPLLQAPRATIFLLNFRRIPMRPSRRAPDELRAVSLERGVVKYAEGSCMVKFGDTHVLVTATLEERLPPWMKDRNMLKGNGLRDNVAAFSCGIYNGTPVLDLDYAEDSEAETDANFVMTGDGRIIEVQGTAEKTPFSQDEFLTLMALARKGVARLVDLQKMAVA